METQKLCLNLGCGKDEKFFSTDEEKWINIDIEKTSITDIIMDATKLSMCDNNSIDKIVAYHLIEHFGFGEFKRAIVEWWRVLKQGGSLLIECPDLEEIMKLFLNSELRVKYILPIQLPGVGYKDIGPALISHIYGGQGDPYDFHKSGYTKEYLTGVLTGLFTDFVFGESHKDYKVPCISLTCIKK